MVMLLMVTAAIVRKEAIMIADRERRMKYKKQEEQRESVRQNLRDKVASFNVMSQHNLQRFRLSLFWIFDKASLASKQKRP